MYRYTITAQTKSSPKGAVYDEKSIIPLILTILLLLTGCSTVRHLDAAEDRIEHNLDAAENRIEQQFEQADPYLFASPTPDQLTEGDAMSIALEHAGVTTEQAEYLHTDYEIDDGIPQYDVSFLIGRTAYEYEINADTGDILSFEMDA